MSDLLTRLEKLSPKQRKLLELRKAEKLKSPPLARSRHDRRVPLSFAQQRLWFIDQLEPGAATYNVPMALRVEGEFDIAVFERVVREIVRRHEVLRTTYQMVDEQVWQEIDPTETACVVVQDLMSLSAEERQRQMEWLIREEAQQHFDLARGPLIRVKVLQLGEAEHVVLATMHHIVSDGWSKGIFVREFAALYEAFRKGGPSPLPQLPIQYADYVMWQRGWLQGEALEKQVKFWREQLAGVETLELPTDRQRSTLLSERGASVSFEITEELTARLKEMSRREGATLFMLLLAGFQVLLSRYSGQQDIAVGTPIANRRKVETEGLIGFFVNTLVLRAGLSGHPTFRQFLGRVRDHTLKAYDHQDMPFERLVEELQPDRYLNRSPLFQVMFALQNAPRMELQLPGLKLSGIEAAMETAHFELFLSTAEERGRIHGVLSFRTDLFVEATMRRFLDHWQNLLVSAVEDPEHRVAELEMLAEAERRQLVEEWNQTEVRYPDLPVHRMFEEQARKTPAATAVKCAEQQLTYAELNRRANQLAHYLCEMGAGRKALVGICVERSLEMTMAVLAILKAGSAYVPLDPSYPSDRLSYMLENSGIDLLVTQQHFLSSFAGLVKSTVCLDADWHQILERRKADLDVDVDGEDLVYVIYTSGSTGKPKGVAMRHGAASNLLQWQLRQRADLGPCTTLQFASLSFDVSFQEIFATWCEGGTLVVVGDDIRRDPFELWKTLRDENVERVFLPFVALQQLSEAAVADGYTSSLREIITAGEQLKTSPALQKLFRQVPACGLQNQYGPTETHVVTAYRMGRDSREWVALPPIGRPIANTQVYVLNEAYAPVPIRVAGELFLGGLQLARGYVNRPELTAERFVPNPFSHGPGERMYRTGDKVRYLESGDIEYLGRVDRQVKLRGYRIELEEIEAALLGHAEIEQAAVAVLEKEQRLVGYVVQKGNLPDVSSAELREYLKVRLPEYMVPGLIVHLAELPLTPSGKVDRKALPQPDAEPSQAVEQRCPRNVEEEILGGILAQVLKREHVGLDENFFEAGGHSLLAMHVISRARNAFDIDLPVRALFEEPTVAGLAERVIRMRAQGERAKRAPLTQVSREGVLELSFAQQRLWFLMQVMPGNTSYNIPLALRLRGALDIEALQKSIREIVRRHEVLRTRFETVNGKPRQIIEREIELNLEAVDLSGVAA
ncbi:MAG TPA: amino acid adenylation domain-containing protein, partial [Candidatus Angelobacter sp.]